MATQFTTAQTEAKISKAIKALSLTQAKPPTKQEFVGDAIDSYIASLLDRKYIKQL